MFGWQNLVFDENSLRNGVNEVNIKLAIIGGGSLELFGIKSGKVSVLHTTSTGGRYVKPALRNLTIKECTLYLLGLNEALQLGVNVLKYGGN